MNTVSALSRPLSVTVAHAPMVRASDYALAWTGQTLQVIVADAIRRGAAPERFWWHGRLTIDGMPVPADLWHAVRPKPGMHVHLWIPPGGPVALSGLGLFLFNAGVPIAAGAILPTVGAFLTSGLGLGALGVVGQLASRLFTPPAATLAPDSADVAQANRAGIQQNIPRKGQSYPFVFGTARVAPQPLCHVRSYLSGDNEYAETVLALAGPHSMTDIRIGGVPVDDDPDIETWIDNGTAVSRSNQFAQYAGPTSPINRELPKHDIRIDEDGYTNLELRDQATPANSLPGWLRCKSRRNADLLDIRLTIRNPFDASSGAVNQALWFRLRARKVGESTWKNIATLPYVGKGQGDYRRRIRFYFARFSSGSDNPKGLNGFLQPAAMLPAVTNNHAVIKTADGVRFPPAYTFKFLRQPEGIDIYPHDDDSETYFTAGDEYEFDIQRSEMVEASELTDIPTMQASGPVYYDFFDARSISGGKWGVAEDTTDQGDQIYVETAISMFDGDIVPQSATVATLHVRVRNKELSEITVKASALVPNWNGTIWTGQAASSSPADHARNIWAGGRTVAAIAETHLDDEELGDWADECAAQSRAVNMAYYGGSCGEALGIVAACGYARPLEGLKYSVAYYRDTSAERPVQMFTPRNIRNYSWSAGFAPRPGAMLAKFLNADKDFEPDELIVEDPFPVPGAVGDIEEVEFPGFTTQAEVTARGEFDFAQLRRNIEHRFECGFEYLSSETRPGKVAVLSHDALHSQAAWGRVASVTNGTSFVLDADIGYSAEAGWFTEADFFSADDFFEGERWGVAVRAQDTGDVRVIPLEGWSAATRTVTVADTSDISPDDLCTFGPMELVTRRVIILRVDPQDGDIAEISCQDEGYDWPIGYGAPAGLLLDSLVLEADGLALDFLTATALVRDTATPANAFLGDINDLLTYASPSVKYVMSAAGVLEAGTTLRTDHDKDGNALGLLIEEQATNNLLDSTDLSTGNWSWGDTSGSIVAGDAALISGQTFWTVTSGDISTDRRQAVSVTETTRQNVSVFIKQGNIDFAGFQCHVLGGATTDVAAIKFDFTDQSIATSTSGSCTIHDSGAEDFGNGIYRLWIDFTPGTAGGTGCFVLVHDGATSGAGESAQYWQAEHRYGAWTGGSPIVTASSAVTRAGDDISLATSAFSWSPTEGSIVADINDIVISGSMVAWSIHDGSTANYILNFVDAASGKFQIRDTSVDQSNLTQSIGSDGGKMASAWADSDFAFSAKGAAVSTGSGSVPSLTTLGIGQYPVATLQLNGHLKSLVYRPRRITNAELVAETD